MTSFALAWRTAKRYRARTLLAIAGVAVIGALLFDMVPERAGVGCRDAFRSTPRRSYGAN